MPSPAFIIFTILFIMALGLYSAAQAAVAGMEMGAPIFVLKRTPTPAQFLYRICIKNASLFYTACALGFWLFFIWYATWFNLQLYAMVTNGLPGFFYIIFNLVFFVAVILSGVILPVHLARNHPAVTWHVVVFPLIIVTMVIFPLAWIIHFLVRKYFTFAGNSFIFGSLQLRPLVSDHHTKSSEATLAGLDHEIYQNAMEFSALRVRDCMTPRTEIIAVEKGEALEVVKQHFINSGHSKLLVFKESVDNVIGYIHLIDMYRKPSSIDKILMPITIAPESMTAGELLKQLIDRRRSMAVVVDEFGGTSGLVTIEDLIEEIIGDIEDEYDIDDDTERKISDTEYVFSARLEIDYLNEKYNLDLPEGDYDTLGGLIFFVHQNIPKTRDVISLYPFEFVILSTAKARILDVRLRIKKQE